MIKMKMLIACLFFALTTASFNVLAGVDVVYVGNKGDCAAYVNDSNLVLAPSEVKLWLKNNSTYVFSLIGGGLHFCSRSAKQSFNDLFSSANTRLFAYLLEGSVDVFEEDINPVYNLNTKPESKVRGEVFNLQNTLSSVFTKCPPELKHVACLTRYRDTIIESQHSVNSQQYIASLLDQLAVENFSINFYVLLGRSGHSKYSKHHLNVRDFIAEQMIIGYEQRKLLPGSQRSIERLEFDWRFYFEMFKKVVHLSSVQKNDSFAHSLLRGSESFFYIWDELDNNKKQALYEYFSIRYSKRVDYVNESGFDMLSVIKELKDFFEFMLLSDSNNITEEVLRDFIDRTRGHFGEKHPYSGYRSMSGSLLSNAIIRYGIKNRLYWSESFIKFYVGEIMNGRFTYLKHQPGSAIKYSLPILFFYSDIEGSKSVLEQKVKEAIEHLKKTNCLGIDLYISGTKERPVSISCESYLSDIDL